MSRNFEEWLNKFRASISGYDYYVNYDKVVENVMKLRIELNILNSLIGSKNIKEDFANIVTRYPETLKCIPLLLAVRGTEIYAQDEEGAFTYNFKKMNYSVEQYEKFMEKTGLFDLLSNHLVNNLIDYALGVETGLDSNGRKNRGGHQMENLVENYIQKAGFVSDVNYFKEMYLSEIRSISAKIKPIRNKLKIAKATLETVPKIEKLFDIEREMERKVIQKERSKER